MTFTELLGADPKIATTHNVTALMVASGIG